MKRLRLGLIGIGAVGRLHLKNCLNLENVEVVSVADTSKRALNEARSLGVKNCLRDWHELIAEPNLDAVVISVPNYLHCEIASRAAEEGKNIFLEKPLARTVEEGKEILHQIEKNGVRLMVGSNLIFDEQVQQLKHDYDKGLLGHAELATCNYLGTGPYIHTFRPVPTWWFDFEKVGGGALLDLGCHVIDLLRWFFSDVSQVFSHLSYRFHLPLEDSASLILTFKNGTKSSINVGWFLRNSHRYVFTIWGTVAISQADSLRLRSQTSEAKRAVQLMAKNLFRKMTGKGVLPGSNKSSPLYCEMRHFTSSLLRDSDFIVSAEKALGTLKVISAAYEAFKKKKFCQPL